MMQLSDLQIILGKYLFDGAGDIAGLALFCVALFFLTKVTSDPIVTVVLLLPLMLVFSLLGVISVTITFVMIIIMVLIIALNVSGAIFGGS